MFEHEIDEEHYEDDDDDEGHAPRHNVHVEHLQHRVDYTLPVSLFPTV